MPATSWGAYRKATDDSDELVDGILETAGAGRILPSCSLSQKSWPPWTLPAFSKQPLAPSSEKRYITPMEDNATLRRANAMKKMMKEWIKSNVGALAVIVVVVVVGGGGVSAGIWLLSSILQEIREMRAEIVEWRTELRETRVELRNEVRDTKDDFGADIRDNRG